METQRYRPTCIWGTVPKLYVGPMHLISAKYNCQNKHVFSNALPPKVSPYNNVVGHITYSGQCIPHFFNVLIFAYKWHNILFQKFTIFQTSKLLSYWGITVMYLQTLNMSALHTKLTYLVKIYTAQAQNIVTAFWDCHFILTYLTYSLFHKVMVCLHVSHTVVFTIQIRHNVKLIPNVSHTDDWRICVTIDVTNKLQVCLCHISDVF